MRSVKVFFFPLIAFAVLMVGMLVVFVFLPAIGTSTTSMSENVTAAHPDVATKIWGWTWISNSSVVMLLVVFLFLFFGLWHIGVGWIKSRFGR